MPDATCVFLKPYVTEAVDKIKQQEDFDNFIKPAIERARLRLLGNAEKGLIVRDITPDLIGQIHRADVVLIDANAYPDSIPLTLSPFLSYLVGFSHSLGNKTILIASSKVHLPAALQKEHTLNYSSRETTVFWAAFERHCREILTREVTRPDNPIQEYLEREQKQTELEAKNREIANLRAQPPGSSPKIAFRRVN